LARVGGGKLAARRGRIDMGVFKRFADIVSANVNDMLDRAEDPEIMLKQMIVEMEEAVNKATMAVGSSIANEKTLQRQVDAKNKEAGEFQNKAIQAINLGREDLARTALEGKTRASQAAAQLEPALAEAKKAADHLRGELDRLKGKLNDARSRQGALIARSQAAAARKSISQGIAGIGDGAFANFEKMERKIEKMEAEADAFGQMAGGNEPSLDEELARLTANTAVDDELAKLKASLGK